MAQLPRAVVDEIARLRARDLERALDRAEPLALEHAPDHLDLHDRQHRMIGDRALGGAPSLTHAFAQEIGRRRISLGKRVDAHDARKHGVPTGGTSNRNNVHGDIGLIATQPKTTQALSVIAVPGL